MYIFLFSYQRHETDPIGKLCLNLSQCPKDSTFTKHLYTLMENIVTKVPLCSEGRSDPFEILIQCTFNDIYAARFILKIVILVMHAFVTLLNWL